MTMSACTNTLAGARPLRESFGYGMDNAQELSGRRALPSEEADLQRVLSFFTSGSPGMGDPEWVRRSRSPFSSSYSPESIIIHPILS